MAYAFEDYSDLATIAVIERNGVRVAALLTVKDGSGLNKSQKNIQGMTGFKASGLHPTPRTDLVDTVFEQVENGIGDLPDGEKIVFDWSSFCDGEEFKEELVRQANNAPTRESEFLAWSRLARIQKLAADKIRKQTNLIVYGSCTIKGGSQGADFLERLLARVFTFWQVRFENKADEITREKLTRILIKIHESGVRYQQILTKMGLDPIFMTEEEMWEVLCRKLGSPATKIPHLLILDDSGLREEFYREQEAEGLERPMAVIPEDEPHALSVLLQNGVPQATRQWIKLPTPSGGKKYVAVLTLDRKPAGFKGKLAQLRFLHDLVSHPEVHDIEIVSEVSRADAKLQRASLQMMTRQSVARDLNVREKSKTIDVSAEVMRDRSVEAQRKMFTGDIPYKVGLAILVYRDSPEELDDACRLLQSLIHQPAVLERETEYPWMIWLQTLQIRQEQLLAVPYLRLLRLFRSELSGFINAMRVLPADKTGFELIAEEDGSPLKFDLLGDRKVMLVVGIQGSGKSVMCAEIVDHSLTRGMSCVIVDLPNKDGVGTFKDFTKYHNGAYLEFIDHSYNVVDQLNVDHLELDSDEKQDRIDEHRADVMEFQRQLILGSNPEPGFLTQTIENMIPLGLQAFYADPEIQDRFEAARNAEIGSPAHQNTPTLRDLLRFYRPENLKIDFIQHELGDKWIQQALTHIQLRLNYWISSSRIGDAISKPTNFRADSKLTTFALTGVSQTQEAELMASLAYMAATRQALSCMRSLFFMDEISVLMRYPALASLVGRMAATGRKTGMSILSAGQETDSIETAKDAAQFLRNLTLKIIGRVEHGAIPSFKCLGIPEEAVRPNAGFKASRHGLYTRWLVDYQGNLTQCRFYPSTALLSLTGNENEERAARERYAQQYPNSKFNALAEYSKYYIPCLQQGVKP